MAAAFWVGPEGITDGVWKFVRVGDEFRFFDISYLHREAMIQEERPRVRSAGLIGVIGRRFRYLDNGSETLRIRGDDTEALTKALQMECLGR